MSKENKHNEQWELLVISLKEISEKKGIKQEEIAEKSGLIQSNISRFFSLKYKPNIDTFIKVANAIGVKLIIK